MVSIKLVVKFLLSLFLRSQDEELSRTGNVYLILVLCILWQRNSPLNCCSSAAPGAYGSSGAVRLCSVPDVIQRMHKPRYCLTATAGLRIAVSAVAAAPGPALLLPSPVSLHLRRAPSAFLCPVDFQKQLSDFGFSGDLAFHSYRRKLKLVRGESGSWTQPGLHCLASWPLLCSQIIASLTGTLCFFSPPPLFSFF